MDRASAAPGSLSSRRGYTKPPLEPHSLAERPSALGPLHLGANRLLSPTSSQTFLSHSPTTPAARPLLPPPLARHQHPRLAPIRTTFGSPSHSPTLGTTFAESAWSPITASPRSNTTTPSNAPPSSLGQDVAPSAQPAREDDDDEGNTVWAGPASAGPSESTGTFARAQDEKSGAPPAPAKKVNPLQDLIRTERLYVVDLSQIIKKVAAAWSRSNFPPAELDAMFRAIEAVYRINKSLLAQLEEIGPSPSSPKALGDLLMRWIPDLNPAYSRYTSSLQVDFDSFSPVQSNPKLAGILYQLPFPTSISENAPPDSPPPSATPPTMDLLFSLPHTRLVYYKRLYTKLLKSTKEGRSDHALLVTANETIDRLLLACEEANSRSLVGRPRGGRSSNGSGSEGLGGGNSSSTRSSSNTGTSLATTATPLSASQPRVDELERRLNVDRALDIFTMQPKKCKLQMAPASLPFTRHLRRAGDVHLAFTPLSTRQPVNTPSAYIFLLTDLFLICSRMTPSEHIQVNASTLVGEVGQDMWLLYPPLAGKHLRVEWIEGGDGRELEVTIMRKERLRIGLDTREDAAGWKAAFEDVIQFGQAQGTSLKSPLPVSPTPSPSAASFTSKSYSRSGTPSPLPNVPPEFEAPPQERSYSEPIPPPPPPPRDHPSRDASPSMVPPPRKASMGLPGHPRDGPRRSSTPSSGGHPDSYGGGRGGIESMASGLSLSDSGGQLPPGAYPPTPHQPPYPSTSQPSPYPHYHNTLPPPPQQYYEQQPSPRTHQFSTSPSSSAQYPAYPQPQSHPQPHSNGLHHSLSSRSNGSYASDRTGRSSAYPDPPPPMPSQNRYADPRERFGFHSVPTSRRTDPGSGPDSDGGGGLLSPGNSMHRSRSAEGFRDGHYRMPSESFTTGGIRGASSAPGSSYGGKARSTVDDDDSPPASPTVSSGPTKSVVAASMRCKAFLQQQHAQWKSLGTARLKLFVTNPGNTKQIVVESDKSDKKTFISTIVLTDGVERMGKVGVAIELSDQGKRTGIIYMLQMKTEAAATGLFEQLLLGSDREVRR